MLLSWLVVCCLVPLAYCQTAQERHEAALTALEYVERVRGAPCSGGTEETLPVNFDHSMWSQYADVAVRNANLLSSILTQANNSLGGVSEAFLFELVRNTVDDDSFIFGSAVAVEEHVFPKYRLFCPYAYKKDKVYAHDISLNYDYLSPTTEWYHTLRMRSWQNATISRNQVTYRYNTTSHDVVRMVSSPRATRSDGHWTRPYYDCGGGDIWMVTYSSPLLGIEISTNKTLFRGIATIDIELTNIDINQCDLNVTGESDTEATSSVGVFRGTHNCRPSTQCVHVPRSGFVRGSYLCECRPGYYFPDLSAKVKAFNGTLMEGLFMQNSSADDAALYECLPCAEGCETCVDNSPCLYLYNLYLRLPLLVLAVPLLCFIIVCSAVVWINQDFQVIKAASPIFLQVMNAGAALMCVPFVLGYMEPTVALCAFVPWARYLGFAMAYGALLLKTYRIAAIFRVKSAKRVQLSDRLLARRFVPVLGVPVVYLTAWTVIGRPTPRWMIAANTLKFRGCSVDYWEYIAEAGEAVFLLWGAYLSFVVRRAPTHFNESKYITWAIYNYIILGFFITIIQLFVSVREGPDILYLTDFFHLQISVTSILLLIYLPKFHLMYQVRVHPEKTILDSHGTQAGTVTKDGAAGYRTQTMVPPVAKRNVQAQTDLIMNNWPGNQENENFSRN